MATLKDAELFLIEYKPFSTSTLSGAWEPGEFGSDYVVRSYGTVIATFRISPWGETWHATTTERYSVTTSKHLNIVKRAWGLA